MSINLASAVTPNIGWRHHLLMQFAPFEALRLSHAAAVPASVLLFATAPYLWRKREGALRLAIVLLVGLGVLDLLKGLDFEESVGSFSVAGVLWLGTTIVLRSPRPRDAADCAEASATPRRIGSPALRLGRLARRAGEREPRCSRPRDRCSAPLATGPL